MAKKKETAGVVSNKAVVKTQNAQTRNTAKPSASVSMPDTEQQVRRTAINKLAQANGVETNIGSRKLGNTYSYLSDPQADKYILESFNRGNPLSKVSGGPSGNAANNGMPEWSKDLVRSQTIPDFIRERTQNLTSTVEDFISGYKNPYKQQIANTDKEALAYMTEDEQKEYSYLLGKDSINGTTNASKYAESLRNKNVYKEALRRFKNYQNSNTAGRIIHDIADPYVAGIDNAVQGSTKRFTNFVTGKNKVEDPSVMENYYGMMSDSAAKSGNKLPIINHTPEEVLQNIAFMQGNMAPSQLVGGVGGALGAGKKLASAMGAAAMFPQVAGSAYNETLRDTGDVNRSRLYGFTSGLNESLGEYFLGGVENVSGGFINDWATKNLPNSLAKAEGKTLLANASRALAKVLMNPVTGFIMEGAQEGAEEIIQGTVDTVLRNAILGENNEVDPFSEDNLYSAFVAALSVYGSNLGPSIANNAQRNAYGNQTMQVFRDMGYDYQKLADTMPVSEEDYTSELGLVDKQKLQDAQEAQALAQSLATKEGAGARIKASEKADLAEAINKVQDNYSEHMGNKLRAQDLELKPMRDAEMVENIRGGFNENGKTAFDAISGDKVQKARSFAAYYNTGRFGIEVPENLQETAREVGLTQEEIASALRAGAADANNLFPVKASTEMKRIAKNIKAKGRQGSVKFDGVDYNSLTTQQKMRVDFSEALLTKGLGMDVIFVQSGVEDGKYQGANGAYQTINGRPTITLDVNAGMNYESDWTGQMTDIKTLLPTISHELTHFLEKANKDAYQQIAQAVVGALQKSGKYSKGLSFNEILNEERNRLDNVEQRSHTNDDALHEIVARACEDMLSGNKQALQAFENLDANTKKTISDHIKEIFDNIRDFFEQMLKEYRSGSAEARAIRSNMEEFEKIRKMWNEALGDVTEETALTEAFGEDTGEIIRDNDGNAVIAESEDGQSLVYSMRTLSTTQEKLADVLRNKGYSEESIKAAQNQVETVAEMLNRVSTYYAEMADALNAELLVDPKTGKTVLHSFVTNGEYPVNIDFLTICKKREAYMHVLTDLIGDGVFDQVAFNGAAIAMTNEILRDSGFETACACCFVESRRLQIQRWAETFCSEWNEEVLKRNPNATPFEFSKGDRGANSLTQDEILQLEQELRSVTKKEKNPKGNIKLPNKGARANMGPLLDRIPSLAHTLSVGDLITPNGIDSLRTLDGNLFSLVKQRYGTATPKITQAFSPYNGDVADLSYGFMRTEINETVPGSKKYKTNARAELVAEGIKKPTTKQVEDRALRKYLYDIGGVRLQSFSDFLIENTLDYFQMFADLSAKELPLHAYSKEISFIKIFGMTGGKMNMSLIPVVDLDTDKEHAGLKKNADGTYSYAGWGDYEHHIMIDNRSFIQSIGFKDAIALQLHPGYSSHIGTIAIGISNAHIRKMLNDPLIRMVIPYHASGMLPEFAKQMHIDYYHDYTTTQNTTLGKCTDLEGNVVETYKLKGDDSYKCDTNFDFNEAFQRLGDARAACEEYKEWCKEKHPVYKGKAQVGWAEFIPKFNEFAEEHNYYKLIEDFNSYDCITEKPAIQGAVTMNFPGAEQNILSETELQEYADRLRATGEFTEKEIQKYVSRANDGLEDIITKEAKNRNAYHRAMDEKYDATLKKIEDRLKKDFNKADYELVDNQYKRVSEKQLSARPSTENLDAKQLKNYQYNESKTEIGDTLKTLKGSAIKRSSYGVGKDIGGQYYFQKNYASDIIPGDVLSKAESVLKNAHPDFKYNAMMYQPSKDIVRFDEAPDFDTAREPMTGDYISVNVENGTTKKGHSDYIWHHKWLWVDNDYDGFDVAESWNWSKQWLNTLTEVADGNGIGRWNAQLDRFGLPHDGGADDDHVKPVVQHHTSAGTSINKAKVPAVFTNKKAKFVPGGTNIDIGGGKFDTATEYLATLGVENVIYDPFNRSKGINQKIIGEIRNGKRYDTATVSNVLNVIDTPEARANVILEAAKAIKPDGEAYFTFYSDKKQTARETKEDQWQEFREAKTYKPEIEQYFDDVSDPKGGMIIAKNPKKNLPKAIWAFDNTSAVQYSARDTEYMNAVKSHDIEAAQKMVDEAAKKHGYTLKVYHGTGAKFNEFSKWHANYFSPSRAYSEQYDENVMSIYLNPGNVFDTANNKQARDIFNNEFLPYAVKKEWMSPAEANSKRVKAGDDADFTVADDLYSFLKSYNRKHGTAFDAIKIFENGGFVVGDEAADIAYIPLDNKLIKLADPVTYDDNGNVIPLSERFNNDNSDIRYSMRGDYVPTFYSKLQREIEGFKGDKIGAASVESYLKGKGVKEDEIKWSGIRTFLEGKKSVNKEELMAYLKTNQLQIEEIVLDNRNATASNEQYRRLNEINFEKSRLAEDLYDEFKAEYPDTTQSWAGYDSSAAIISKINRAIRKNHGLIDLRVKLRPILTQNGLYGFDTISDVYRAIEDDMEMFFDEYDVSPEDEKYIREYQDAVMNTSGEITKYVNKVNAIQTLEEEERKINTEISKEESKYGTRWHGYSLTGGENYREILFRMPGSNYQNAAMSTHWGNDNTGILAHARVHDFTTNDGKKVLFLEEIQSDWHNAGQKKGYLDEVTSKYADMEDLNAWANRFRVSKEIDKIIDAIQRSSGILPTNDRVTIAQTIRTTIESAAKNNAADKLPELFKNGYGHELSRHEINVLQGFVDAYAKAAENNDKIQKARKSVPDAPFRNSYTDFVLKNLLRQAAEGGYDYVAWTPASMQMERWNPERQSSLALTGNGASDDVAFEEGYRIEYDQDIPKFLKKYGKQWGANLSEIALADSYGDVVAPKVPAINVNDAMKESVLYAGQPMFSQRNVDLDQRLDALVQKYGALPKGEKAVKDISVPEQTSDGKRVRRYARTVLESGITSDMMDDEIKEKILKEGLSYEPVTDESAAEYAASVLRIGGTAKAQKEWDRARRSDTFNKDAMAVGQELLREYAKQGDVENVVKMVTELAAEGTRMGQNIQAMRMLKKYATQSPAIGLGYIQRTVDIMNREAKAKMGKRYKEMVIDQRLADEYVNASTKDEIDAALGKIYKNLGSQVQKTVGEEIIDRLRAWRYSAMLGNPRTHVRNLVGNALFVPAVTMKNAIGSVLEAGTKEKTKALITSKAARQFAAQDAIEMKDVLQGNADKSIRQLIADERKTFLNPVLNKFTKMNGDALEYEDWIFLRYHYQNALAQYITANKLDVNNLDGKDLAKARQYAVKEAQKATYRDASKVSTWLNQSSGAGAVVKYMMEGMLPFKKTPANILKRGIEYSPAMIVERLSKGLIDLNRGNITVNEWIDGMASGLTGTALFGLGMFLASVGAVLGGYKDDDDKKKRKLKGEQEYAAKIGDYTYTIDWAAPAALPLFMGVETMYGLREDGDFNMDDMGKSVARLIDPMINMSMLSGLNDTLDAISYSDDKLSAFTEETFYNLLGQYVPTLFGQVARTIDTTQRINYQDMNKGKPKNMLYFIEKMQNKIPYMTFSNDPYLDEFGRENTTEPRWLAAIQNFVSPGYLSKNDNDRVVKAVTKLSERTEEKVLPEKMPKYLGQGDDRMDLTSKQYYRFQRDAGRMSYNIIDSMLDDERYNNLNSDQQAAAIKMGYDYAKASARKELQPDYELKGDSKKIYEAYEEDGALPYDTILNLSMLKNTTGDVTADYDENGDAINGTKKINTIDAILNSTASASEKAKMYEMSYPDDDVYKRWRSSNYSAVDYMKHFNSISGFHGDEKQKSVIDYIKKQTDNKEKQMLMWEMAGYKLDSKKDGVVTTNGNFNKKMGY